MGKFFGRVGFAVTEDVGDGVWKEKITDKKYAGDVVRLQKNRDAGEHINDGLRLNAQFSILMDPWFQDHLSSVRYIEYMNSKWVIETVDPTNYPRVLLTPGGLYHGNEPEPEPDDSGDSGEPEVESEEGISQETEGNTGE